MSMKISKEELEQLYQKSGSIQQLSRDIGIPFSTLQRWMKRYEITQRDKNKIISEAMKGHHYLESHNKKISETRKRLFKEGKLKAWNKDLKGFGEKWLKPFKKGMYQGYGFQKGHIPWNKDKKGFNREWWQNLENREKVAKKILKRLKERPTSLEKEFIKIIKKNNLPFTYCGDGSLLIGFKNPDFYETNGKKICIEVANHYHHPNPWKEKRIAYFDKYGWKCLVFFGICSKSKATFEKSEEQILKEIMTYTKTEMVYERLT